MRRSKVRRLMVVWGALGLVLLSALGAMAAGPHVSVPKGELQGGVNGVLLKKSGADTMELALEWNLQYGLSQEVSLAAAMIYPSNQDPESVGHFDVAWQANKYLALFGGARVENYRNGTSQNGLEGGGILNLQVGYSVVRGVLTLGMVNDRVTRDTEIGLEVPFGYRMNLEFSYRDLDNGLDNLQGLSMGINLAF